MMNYIVAPGKYVGVDLDFFKRGNGLVLFPAPTLILVAKDSYGNITHIMVASLYGFPEELKKLEALLEKFPFDSQNFAYIVGGSEELIGLVNRFTNRFKKYSIHIDLLPKVNEGVYLITWNKEKRAPYLKLTQDEDIPIANPEDLTYKGGELTEIEITKEKAEREEKTKAKPFWLNFI